MEYLLKLTFDAERALYGKTNCVVDGCVFEGDADGESQLKEVNGIQVKNCKFCLRYPLWHATKSVVESSSFNVFSRAPIWYCNDITIANCQFDCIKPLRECQNVTVDNCVFNSTEFGWYCNGLSVKNTKINAEYAFMQSKNVTVENLDFSGKYSFQYIKDCKIVNSRLNTKDAFWHAENVVLENCELTGEYLGWYSKNLTLKKCKITGTQPLCYAQNLVLENCEMTGCDLCFEHTTVNATVTTKIDSVKNPIGYIKAPKIDAVIIDEFKRGNVIIDN